MAHLFSGYCGHGTSDDQRVDAPSTTLDITHSTYNIVETIGIDIQKDFSLTYGRTSQKWKAILVICREARTQLSNKFDSQTADASAPLSPPPMPLSTPPPIPPLPLAPLAAQSPFLCHTLPQSKAEVKKRLFLVLEKKELWTNGRTDKPSLKGARTHIKTLALPWFFLCLILFLVS